MKKLNKTLIAAVLIALIGASFCFVAISFAAYTHSSRAQRTIAAYPMDGESFSSNYLIIGDSSANIRTLYVTNAALMPSTVVTVCNYRQGMQNKPNEESISYSIEMKLCYYDQAEGEFKQATPAYLTANSLTGEEYKVTVISGSVSVTLGSAALSDTTTFSGTLAGRTANSHSYTVILGTGFAADNPNLYFEMNAIPDGGLSAISGMFTAGLKAEGATNNWTGAFNESTLDGYDGFNYVVTGTGEGTFYLRWDSSIVELSYQSLRMLDTAATRIGETSYYYISFAVDSDTESRYDLQFYKVDVDGVGWGDMQGRIDYPPAAPSGSGKVVEYAYNAS